MVDRGIHFLALDETNISSDIQCESLKINGYKFGRNVRNRHGGGIAYYCKDTLKCEVRHDVPVSDLEMLCVEITPPKARPYIILLWYRPPSDNKDTFEKLENVLLFLEHEGKEVILLGDTNCDLSDANSPRHVKSIKDIYATYGLKQLIKEPTRQWRAGRGAGGQLPPLRVKYEGRQNDNLKTWAPKVPFFCSANQIVSKFSPRILLQT